MQEHQEILIDETDALEDQRALPWRNRLFVCFFLLSVCACLVALCLSGILVSVPDQLWQLWLAPFLQFVSIHRWLVLVIPAACLLVCYARLRSLTGEIMTVPERYLDERQQMLRNQAHRSAFKILKLACILIPVGVLLLHLSGLNTASTAPVQAYRLNAYLPNANLTTVPTLDKRTSAVDTWTVYNVTSSSHIGPILVWNRWSVVYTLLQPTHQANLPTPPVTTADIVLAGGLLLLCFWLLLSALPMCVLAWQGRR